MNKKKELKKIISKYQYNTPFYFYDRNIIREQIKKIKSAFLDYENFELYYAIKANYSDIVLDEIKNANIGIAVSSQEELNKIQKCKIKSISYTAPYTPSAVIKLANQGKIELNFNNYSELCSNPLKNIGLRINPEIGWSYIKDFCASSKHSQFGVPYKEALELDLSKISRLHMHTSSDSYSIDIFIRGLKRLLLIVEKFSNIDTINLGGGIATPIGKEEKDFDIKLYAEKIIKTVREFNKKYNRNLKIQIEPGNYIVRPSAYYICKVEAMDKKNNQQYYFTNGTKHHLKGLSNIQKIQFITKVNKKADVYIIGCTCQKSDVLYEGVMPTLNVNDLIIVPMVGAYCLAQSDNFHLLNKPIELSAD